MASLVSYVPTEALTIYLAGVACVNLVQTPNTAGEKVAAVWVLFVIALVANARSCGWRSATSSGTSPAGS